MKKILFLSLLTLCFMVSCNETKAQSQALMYTNSDTTTTAPISSITTSTRDTLYDASTVYTMYTKTGALANMISGKYVVTFLVTKISGTGTARAYLQGSTDGVTWRDLNTNMLGTDGFNSDTLNIAAASTTALQYTYYSANGQAVLRPTLSSAVYYVNSGRMNYLRFKLVGTGTQATVYSAGKVTAYN